MWNLTSHHHTYTKSKTSEYPPPLDCTGLCETKRDVPFDDSFFRISFRLDARRNHRDREIVLLVISLFRGRRISVLARLLPSFLLLLFLIPPIYLPSRLRGSPPRNTFLVSLNFARLAIQRNDETHFARRDTSAARER